MCIVFTILFKKWAKDKKRWHLSVQKNRKKNVISLDANCKGNRLNKDIKKDNFKKDLMNLTETNHQINLTSDHSVSSNILFKSLLNASSCAVAVVQSTEILLQCLLQGWRERIRVMWIQLQEKNEKDPHHQLYQQRHHLMVIEETFNVKKT